MAADLHRDHNLWTLRTISVQVQATPQDVEELLIQLGIHPTYLADGVAVYLQEDVESLRQYLNQQHVGA
jgi:hypothetical protein